VILLLDTSTAICNLTFVEGENLHNFEWKADKALARGFLKFLDTKLKENNKSWGDISAIGVFEGPGSFTGIRIGLTVMNTIADTQNIPIVGGRGESWKDIVLEKLNSGKNEKIVLPYYGGEANITSPRK
jgi:tRNA threonylcarbamoyladenosine biosynthesis protein TsaB